MSIPDDIFTSTTQFDFFYSVCGEMLGYGAAREVYRCLLDPSLVVKIERSQRQSFQNVHEWDVWERVQYTKLAKWFAPCVRLSFNGKVLLQKRTSPIRFEELPAKIPNFLTDLKPENWGIYEGRPVVHDYALNLLMEKGMTSRLIKPDWNMYGY